MDSSWELVAHNPRPSGYMDALVARQKRDTHLRLARRWMPRPAPQSVLKTDLFEEAFGEDHILFDLAPGATLRVGMDIAAGTIAAARRRGPPEGFSSLAADARALGLRTGSFEFVFSNSTLDHFATRAELQTAVGELARIVRPGGALVITLDNPWNPFYYLLRWAARLRHAPFVLGCTASRRQLNAWLEGIGMEVVDNDWLIHNPRLLSTLLFLGLRKVMGRAADGPIRVLLRMFELLGRLPTAPFTACFLAVCARKPGSETAAAARNLQAR